MVRLMLFAVLLLACVVVAWLLIGLAQSAFVAKPMEPTAGASNETWRRYYSALAESARSSGDIDSAVTYESLADTYRQLDES